MQMIQILFQLKFISLSCIILLVFHEISRYADKGEGDDHSVDIVRTPCPATIRGNRRRNMPIAALRVVPSMLMDGNVVNVVKEGVTHNQRTQSRINTIRDENNITTSGFDPSSTTITNDIPWMDDRGHILETGRGGKITHFDGWFWWVGSQPNKTWTDGGDIFLYKSLNIGSNSWQFVRKVYEFPNQQTSANCQIHKHPTLGTIHIHCKNRTFLVSRDGIMGEFEFIQPKPLDPSGLGWQGWNWGSCTVFRDGNDMYMAASRIDKSKPQPGETRKGFIYKLRDDWLAFADGSNTNANANTNITVVEFPWAHREAYHIFRYDGWWYLGASATRGWKPSKSYYRRSRTLEGLKDAQEHEMIMHPSSSKDNFLSMGTQFRFLFEIKPGKWIFGGSRHPDEDPDHFDAKFGRYVMVPAQFIDGVPTIYWKRQFDWNTYDYSSGDFDPHNSTLHTQVRIPGDEGVDTSTSAIIKTKGSMHANGVKKGVIQESRL